MSSTDYISRLHKNVFMDTLVRIPQHTIKLKTNSASFKHLVLLNYKFTDGWVLMSAIYQCHIVRYTHSILLYICSFQYLVSFCLVQKKVSSLIVYSGLGGAMV